MDDKILTCVDCGNEFVFSASEQAFYTERAFSEPKRDAACRAARKAARGDDSGSGGYRSGGGGEREMYSATCAECGGQAQVPFRPSGGKPVYCSDCFRNRR